MAPVTDQRQDWNSVWSPKPAGATSWFQTNAEPQSTLVRRVSTPNDRVVVVGAGTTPLVAELIAADITTSTPSMLTPRGRQAHGAAL